MEIIHVIMVLDGVEIVIDVLEMDQEEMILIRVKSVMDRISKIARLKMEDAEKDGIVIQRVETHLEEVLKELVHLKYRQQLLY